MVKGYKATYNYKCRNQLYEVGQEYKMDETPSLCTKGFHYCNNPVDVLCYYNFLSCFKLLEIEDLSADTVQDPIFGEKSCTNHMKITREIVGQELLDLLNAKIIMDYITIKRFLFKHSFLGYDYQEVTWYLESKAGKVDTISTSGSADCITHTYKYDKNNNLKSLINHNGDRYIFTEQGFINEQSYKRL